MRNDRGYTLVEILVVILIGGILAAIAIPIAMNQRRSAWETQVRSDVSSWSTGATQHQATAFAYPITLRGFAMDEASGPRTDHDTQIVAFVIADGPDGGFVIFAKSVHTSTVYVSTSFSDPPSTVTKTNLTALPTSPPAAGTFDVPADVTASSWSTPTGLTPTS